MLDVILPSVILAAGEGYFVVGPSEFSVQDSPLKGYKVPFLNRPFKQSDFLWVSDLALKFRNKVNLKFEKNFY